MTTFLRAILVGGGAVVSSFDELTKVQQYASQVFSGQKPFNVWRKVADVHPASGEQVAMRSQAMLNGAQIEQIEVVEPISGRENDHGYQPDAFMPVVLPHQVKSQVSDGWGATRTRRFGLWTAPSGAKAVEGAVPGMRYPIHATRDGRKFVILHKAQNPEGTEASELVEDTVFYLGQSSVTAEGSRIPAPAAVADDDDDADEGFADGDDDFDSSF